MCKILDLDKIAGQRRNQRECEISVGDRLAFGQFLFRPLGIDMYPLKIAGRFGEAVYFLLVDFDPVGQPDLSSSSAFASISLRSPLFLPVYRDQGTFRPERAKVSF